MVAAPRNLKMKHPGVWQRCRVPGTPARPFLPAGPLRHDPIRLTSPAIDVFAKTTS
jgi:hypothetical protein